MSQYGGHHKRDEFGNVLSRAEESQKSRLKYPDKHKKWNSLTRNSEGGQQSHQKYNDSEKGKQQNASGHLRRKYGKTLAEKQIRYDQQNGLCALCGDALPVNLSMCAWDHDHATGRMRDLLHRHCNLLVGGVEDVLHDKAVEYVMRHSNV